MPTRSARRAQANPSGDHSRRRPSTAQQLAQKSRQLRAVGEISAALASAWELETTLLVITRITSEVMGVTSCSIYLQDQASGRLILKATTGLAKSAIGVASLEKGEGLTGWTAMHGRPIAARDARADARFKLLPETQEESLPSLLAVPLTVQGRTIGAMNVQTSKPHDFSDDEIDLVSLIANLAAGALEKASLHDRMRQQISELEGLVKVSQTVISPLYLDDMLGVVAEMATRVMGAEAVVLHLLDEATGRLAIRAAHNNHRAGGLPGYSSSSPQSPSPWPSPWPGERIIETVARDGQAAAVTDIRPDPSSNGGSPTADESLVSLLSVPLIVRDRTVGALTCHTAIPHEFSQKEINLFSMLANQTALAIENARLVINTAVVREMHHRVKNNLQTVAMLLRLQMSAAGDKHTKDILGEAMTRILSIAAVHETLSEQGLELVNARQVLERIARNAAELAPGINVSIEVQGDELSLPSRAATSLAIVAGELVQNAIKHAFAGRVRGSVVLTLKTGKAEHELVVVDDGTGHSHQTDQTDQMDQMDQNEGEAQAGEGSQPPGEPAERKGGAPSRSPRGGGGEGSQPPLIAKGLGLEIVETLVTHDLKGHFSLCFSSAGTRAVVRFPPITDQGATA
ncbi:MAG: GAF domain-containing protein [Pseudomonadota bacterium]